MNYVSTLNLDITLSFCLTPQSTHNLNISKCRTHKENKLKYTQYILFNNN